MVRLPCHFKFTLKLINKAPIGMLRDKFFGGRLYHAYFVKSQGVKPYCLLGVILPSFSVRDFLKCLKNILGFRYCLADKFSSIQLFTFLHFHILLLWYSSGSYQVIPISFFKEETWLQSVFLSMISWGVYLIIPSSFKRRAQKRIVSSGL